MWCRALLAATALACTFQSEIIADGQSTSRKDQLKDVVCVLILNGLKKEDLDVNVLKKLQRHDVNIDGMDNEKIREDCLLNFKTTRTKEILRDIETLTSSRDKRQMGKLQKQNDDYQEEYPKMEDLLKLWKIFGKANLQNKEDVTTRAAEITTQFTTPTTLNQHINERNDSLRIDIQDVKKIIDSYIATRMIATSTQDPTTKPMNVFILSQKIKQHLDITQNDYNNKNIPANVLSEIIKQYLDITQNDYNNKNIPANVLSEIIKQYLDITQNDYNNKLIPENYQKVLGQITQEDAKLKSNHSSEKITTKFNNELSNDENVKRILDQLKPFGLLRSDSKQRHSTATPETTQHVTENMNHTTKIENNILPANVIKEITERVKTLVLKDLQKEIYSSLRDTTTTTTEATTTTTQEIEHEEIKEVKSVLENFMKLFQQFKTIKESAIITADSKYKHTEKKNTRNEFHGPINVLYPPFNTVMNGYNVNNNSFNLTPIIVNAYSDVPHITTPIVQHLNLTKKGNIEMVFNNKPHHMSPDYYNVNSLNELAKNEHFNNRPITHGVPITIQTNADEILPLGISLPNTVKLLNQNIIVTTKHPMVQYREEQQHREHGEKYNKNTGYSKERLLAYLQPNTKYNNDVEKTHKKLINTTLNSREGLYAYLRPYVKYNSDVERMRDEKYRDTVNSRERLYTYLQTDAKYNNDVKRTYNKYKTGPAYSRERQHSFLPSVKYNNDVENNKRQKLHDYLLNEGKYGNAMERAYRQRLHDLSEIDENVNDMERKRHEYSHGYDMPYSDFRVDSRDKSHKPRSFYNSADKDRNNYRKQDYRDYDRVRSHDYANERFHDKLERSNNWQGPPREYKHGDRLLEVASREQLSMNNLKKRPRHDDSHFKLFLKTQQKVNDMLESILASKTTPDRARSVELT